MEWRFLAPSTKWISSRDGHENKYVIEVRKDGRFQIIYNVSAGRFIKENFNFSSLQEAKDFCEKSEEWNELYYQPNQNGKNEKGLIGL